MTVWQELLQTLYPVFVTVETTGVHSEDQISAVSVATFDCPDPSLHLFDVDESRVADAAQFIGLTEDQYRSTDKEDRNAIPNFLLSTAEWADSNGSKAVMATYNPKFQCTYLAQLNRDTTLPCLDLCQLAWCVGNTVDGAIEGDSINNLNHCLDSLTAAVRRGSYKAILATWGLQIDKDPRSKPAALMKLWTKLMAWYPGCRVEKL